MIGEAYRDKLPQLMSGAMRVTRDRDEAADAVQAGVVSALRNAHKFAGSSQVSTWLYRIVVNAALYARRRAAVRRRLAGEPAEYGDTRDVAGDPACCEVPFAQDEPHDPAAREPHAGEAYVLARIELARAARELAALAPRSRDVVLAALDQEPGAATAARLGVSTSAVKSVRFRAYERLRAARGASRAARQGAGGDAEGGGEVDA
jgi:RNA polymerase sigma factor (sigma-70 family)